MRVLVLLLLLKLRVVLLLLILWVIAPLLLQRLTQLSHRWRVDQVVL
jgi:hypothetical protein